MKRAATALTLLVILCGLLISARALAQKPVSNGPAHPTAGNRPAGAEPTSAAPAAGGPSQKGKPGGSPQAPSSSGKPASGAHGSADAVEAPANPHTGGAPANPHAANPHGANPSAGLEAPRDEEKPDPSLPKGTIVARIVDPSGQALAGVDVRLGTMFQSIAEGNQRHQQTASTGDNGEVRFSGLQTESNFSYRITVQSGPAEFASSPFQLHRDHGQRVLLHVFPVTRDLNQARVAMRGLIYVEPRDDVFQFEAWFQVFNIGQIAWVPDGVTVDLPEGAKAFSARESMADTRFEADGDSRAKLLGTFTPGQHDVRFAFQVPNPGHDTVDFYFSLPPNVGEFRVISVAAKGMSLKVRDFPPVQVSTGVQGERVLVTQKRGSHLDSVHFELAGLPTRGSAPWLAVLIAAATAAGGLLTARNTSSAQAKKRTLSGDMSEARKVILDELVELEKARREERLGPKSYEQTHRALMTALSRMIPTARRRA